MTDKLKLMKQGVNHFASKLNDCNNSINQNKSKISKYKHNLSILYRYRMTLKSRKKKAETRYKHYRLIIHAQKLKAQGQKLVDDANQRLNSKMSHND